MNLILRILKWYKWFRFKEIVLGLKKLKKWLKKMKWNEVNEGGKQREIKPAIKEHNNNSIKNNPMFGQVILSIPSYFWDSLKMIWKNN